MVYREKFNEIHQLSIGSSIDEPTLNHHVLSKDHKNRVKVTCFVYAKK